MKKRVVFSIIIAVLLTACQTKTSSQDLGLLAQYPILEVDVKELTSVMNETTFDSVPQLEYKKMEREPWGYSRTLLFVEGEEAGNPLYQLKANYDHEKNLREISYDFDMGAEVAGETSPSDLSYSLFMYIGIDDKLMKDALLSSDERKSEKTNLWYRLNMYVDDDTEMMRITIRSNNFEKDKK